MAAAHGSGLTDTDILIDAAHGITAATSFVTSQYASAGLQVSVISAMELLVGCRNKSELRKVQRFLRGTSVLHLDVAISDRAYRLMESFFLSHGLLIPDALIAATALEKGLTLFSKNVRHFQMIRALHVVRPY
jgi:predicted nucleic acid-binding protein